MSLNLRYVVVVNVFNILNQLVNVKNSILHYILSFCIIIHFFNELALSLDELMQKQKQFKGYTLSKNNK